MPLFSLPALRRSRAADAGTSPRSISVEAFALLVSLYFTLVTNATAWHHALTERSWTEPGTWAFAACVAVALTAFQGWLMLLVFTRRSAKWLAALLIAVGAVASYFIQTYSVFIDPTMLRNVLRTDTKEARELLSLDLLWHLAWQAALPIWIVSRIALAERRWRPAVVRRVVALAVTGAAFVAALLIAFQDAAAMARNHRELRFLVTPSNALYSLARVATADTRSAAVPRKPVGADAGLGSSWAQRQRPALLVVVVGETVRAANWGLNGYARQTTPELSKLDVINFPDVAACGTNTEVSLPCMFSPWGRHDYDEARIRTHESLLHVLERARLNPAWRDNQSGCKGVCAGLDAQQTGHADDADLCGGGDERCFDEALLRELDRTVRQPVATQVVVLHQLGSHGPAYFRRYPEAFRRFEPTCDTSELRKCSTEQIVNSYDNTILYTDHVLAETIQRLKALERTHDTALIYVSDHGESLGERNLFLHGLPYAIAPKEQTQVPMVWWLSPGFVQSFGIDRRCLEGVAARPASHDHLFHTVLGMLDVRTSVYDGNYDLTRSCRR